MGKVSAAQRRANKKWDDAHKDRKQYITKRSTARNFVKKEATKEDIDELKNLIREREREL